MSRAGAMCPLCGTIMTMEDMRLEGKAGRLGSRITAVMVEGNTFREYRLPTDHELELLEQVEYALDRVYQEVPHGMVVEPLVPESARSISCDLYGLDNFGKLFTKRQQLALGTLIHVTRKSLNALGEMPTDWREAIYRLLSLNIDRVADRSSTLCRPDPTPTQSGVINTFSRFAFPMTWDFIEGVPLADSSGGYLNGLEWIARVIEHILTTVPPIARGQAVYGSAAEDLKRDNFDLIVTDPPYYEAISYADLSDFFYIWQKRLNDNMQEFTTELTDKKKEIVQHVRADKSRTDEREKYERYMTNAFHMMHKVLSEDGRFVIVFAHKQPDAWETLVTAMIQAGFVVTSSWPIQTEMSNRGRALSSAALASSVWLVCKKRPRTAGVGWDNRVLDAMHHSIALKLRDFWDAGIRGPDFVWAATGPALEAYSKHPIVKKADDPGQILTVSEFLTHVRRMVVDFVVGRVLSGDGVDSGEAAADRLDEPTAYYLLHRHDFGMAETPAGTCILYAVSCGLSDQELINTWDLLAKTGAHAAQPEDEETEADPESDPDVESSAGSQLQLKTWAQRRARSMGYEAPGGRPVPLIDRIHRLMHLWKGGDVHKVDAYLDEYSLRRHELFWRVVQSLIELSRPGSEERSLLESLSNHIGARGARHTQAQRAFAYDNEA